MGIEIVLGASSQAVLGDGRATGVSLQDGLRIEGDLILISAGIRSNVQLAREAGIKIGRGVVVDEHLRTSAEGIYAAGDVVEFRGRVYGIIPAALEQAKDAVSISRLIRRRTDVSRYAERLLDEDFDWKELP